MNALEGRKADPIARALSKAPRLRIIYTQRLTSMTECYLIMSSNPNLESLEVVKNPPDTVDNLFGERSSFLQAVDQDPRLQKLVKMDSYEPQRSVSI